MSAYPLVKRLSVTRGHRESVFGYITVLPGAFSAYRYIALQNDVTGEGPLQKYFLGEKMVRIAYERLLLTGHLFSITARRRCRHLHCKYVSSRGSSE